MPSEVLKHSKSTQYSSGSHSHISTSVLSSLQAAAKRAKIKAKTKGFIISILHVEEERLIYCCRLFRPYGLQYARHGAAYSENRHTAAPNLRLSLRSTRVIINSRGVRIFDTAFTGQRIMFYESIVAVSFNRTVAQSS